MSGFCHKFWQLSPLHARYAVRSLDSTSCFLQVDDAFINALATNTSLHTLNLSQTFVTNKGMLILCRNVPHITTLVADGCPGLYGAIPGLSALSSLSKLSLCGCDQVSASHVILSIAAVTRLTYLNLSWCKGSLHCEGDPAAALVRLQALQVLLLDHACLPPELCVAALHAALGLRCLTQLCMSESAFPFCDDQSLLTTANCLDGSDMQGEYSSDESDTIQASWAGEEAMQLESCTHRHIPGFDQGASLVKMSLSISPVTAKLTKLTLRSCLVRFFTHLLLSWSTGGLHILMYSIRTEIFGHSARAVCSSHTAHGSLLPAWPTWSPLMPASPILTIQRCQHWHHCRK
jgi:hypothetical protein